MKKIFAIISLIILNALAYFAGAWVALISMFDAQSNVGAVVKSVLFLAALPTPLFFVWRFFLLTYGFTKKKFFLCTLLPPVVVTAVFGVFVLNLGLTGLFISFLCNAVTICLIISTVIWVSVGGRGEKSPNKAAAIVLLGVCGAAILQSLNRLLFSPIGLIISFVIKPNISSALARQAVNTLIISAVLFLPIGFGAAKLMKIYKEECSLKPPLFMLFAFAPSLVIAGVRMPFEYNGEPHVIYAEFEAQLDTFILTATIALVSAIIYAAAALIRSKKHYY
ncbi:MAG: hypothetical protein K2J77_09385 [Oscillospiraceae bacterium]|nr:hypothetical protein [Oscillospiraceae bacterium]